MNWLIRKPSGPSIDVQWPSIAISWVNLFVKDTLSKISSIKSSTFLEQTITTIFKYHGVGDISFRSCDDLAVKFIKKFFPEIIKEKGFSMKNKDDILILLSLLMYTTCIKCKIEDFVTKTCRINLDDDHQEALITFFELMLNIGAGNYTRRNITQTIKLCIDFVVCNGNRKLLSPNKIMDYKVTLREFLEAPEEWVEDNEMDELLDGWKDLHDMYHGQRMLKSLKYRMETITVDDEIKVQAHLDDDPSETTEHAARGQETSQTHTGTKSTEMKRRIEDMLHACKDLRAVGERIAQPNDSPDNDEIDVFGTYVSKTLKQLSRYDAVCAQRDIEGILTKYRIGNRPQSVSYSSGSPQTSNVYLTDQSGLLSLANIVVDSVTLQ